MKLCAEPHTSVCSSARLCKCFEEQLEEAESGGRSLARPSAESCGHQWKQPTHMTILVLFRNTLELKTP